MGLSPNPPRDGRELFLWAKQVEHDHQVGMVRYLNQFARRKGWPWRMLDWEEVEVAEAYAAAAKALEKYRP